MIDKADFRVPQPTRFQPQFRLVPGGILFGQDLAPVKYSRHYVAIADLRPLGIDALLNVCHRSSDRHDHKVEILETGKKSLAQMAEIITTIFDVDPGGLELMRLDLAADLRDVTVDQLVQVVRVRYKRSTAERGERDYEIIAGRRTEYMRYGKRPNCIRIYDKPAECKARFLEIQKRVCRDGERLDFESLFGFPPEAVISRVERQIAGGTLPVQLSTFAKLQHAAEFNPFTAIEMIPADFPIPDPRSVGTAMMLKLCGAQYLIDKFGFQQARALLNADGNAARSLAPYQAYLQHSKQRRVTQESIYEQYRHSVRKQIA